MRGSPEFISIADEKAALNLRWQFRWRGSRRESAVD